MLRKEIKKMVLDSEYIFRGTTREHLEMRISQCGYYCGSWQLEGKERVPVTSFSLNPLDAIIYAGMRAKKYNYKPFMLAIETDKYIDHMRLGRETVIRTSDTEIEVVGEIGPDDIIEIDSADRAVELCCRDEISERIRRLFGDVFKRY